MDRLEVVLKVVAWGLVATMRIFVALGTLLVIVATCLIGHD